MSESIKLGDIIDLVSSSRQMASMLDGLGDIEQVRKSLAGILEDRKKTMKFMLVLKRNMRAANSLSEASLSFVGGFAPPEDDPSPSVKEEYPERPVPSRVARIAGNRKERARVMGDDE